MNAMTKQKRQRRRRQVLELPLGRWFFPDDSDWQGLRVASREGGTYSQPVLLRSTLTSDAPLLEAKGRERARKFICQAPKLVLQLLDSCDQLEAERDVYYKAGAFLALENAELKRQLAELQGAGDGTHE